MRTSVVLAIVALLLLGYILLVDRGKLSSGELEQRKGTALPELVRARVAKLEIQQLGVTTVLERDVSRDDEAGLWQVAAPYRAEADQDAVDTLLGELEWIDGRRNLGPVNAADQKRFGFDKPRMRVWFTVGDKRVPIIVGGESARGGGVYVQVGNPPQAMIAGKDLIEGLRQEPGHFHTKALHDGMLVSTTTSMELRDAQGSRGVKKRADELWGVLPDAKRLASTQVVQQLVDGLDQLRATRFLRDGKGELARYGLETPRLVLHVEKTKLISAKDADAQGKAGSGGAGGSGATGTPKATREAISFELRVGNACEGHPGESHLLVAGTTKVLCVSDADLDKVPKTTEALREPRLLPFADDELESVRVEHGGKVLTVTGKDGVWSYELTAAGKRQAQGVAREGSVSDWLKALAATNASQLDASAPSEVSGSNVITLRVGRFGSKPPYVVRALAGAAELIAQRGDEPSAASFPASALELLSVEVARFKPLAVLELKEPSLRAIEIQRGGATERVARVAAGSFRVEAPVATAADPVLMPELARLLSSLHAERFVADAARAEHGFATPFAVVRVEHASEAGQVVTEVLTLGAETTGGRFAQRKGDAAVFVIGRQLVDMIASPLADRAALATPIEHLSEARVTHGAEPLHIVRDGEGFVGAPPKPAPPGAVRALAETLATLRAVRVAGYSVADAAYQCSKPFATVSVVETQTSNTPGEHTLSLCADAGGGARYAQRSDQPAVLVLSKETVDRLLGTAPARAAAPAPAAPAAAD